MAVDIGALRKFQELWGPVLESIPAVMDAVAKQADFDRALRAAKADLEKANADILSAKDAAETIRTKSAAEFEALNAKMQAAIEAADRRAYDAEEDSRARINRAKEKAATAEAQADRQKAAVEAAEAQVKVKIAEVEKLHAEAVAAKEAEIAALEKRQAAAEKAIETLKSKLG